MITFILKICILLYLVFTIHSIHSMIQYNSNAVVKTIQIPDKEKIISELQDKNPLLIIYPENKLDLTLQNMNTSIPGYIIQDGETLISLEQVIQSSIFNISNNNKLIDDYNITDHCNEISNLIKELTTCDVNYSLSLYKGGYQSPLYKNYRERLLIQALDNSFVIYLFNPKHEGDIKGVELGSIKKWGIRLEVMKDTIISIPTEWSYFYECKGELILNKIESDTLQTWLFNRIRRK